MTGISGKHAAPVGGTSLPASIKPALVWLVMFAVTIAIVTVVCLVRLIQRGAVPGTSLLLILPVFIASLSVLCGTLAAANAATVKTPLLVYPVIVIALTILLSWIGFVTRLSLHGRGAGAWSQPLIAALGVIALFAAIELTVSYRPDGYVPRAIGLSGVLLLVAECFARPGRHAALPGATSPAEWPKPLLVVGLLGVLAAALASPRSWLVSAEPQRWPRWVPRGLPGWLSERAPDRGVRRAALPVIAALALFAFTRDFGAATVLLVGGLAVLLRADAVAFPPRSGRTTPRLVPIGLYRWVPALVAAAAFAVGAWLVTLVGTQLGLPRFTMRTALGTQVSQPWALLYGHPMTIGPGFRYRDLGMGTSAGGQEILAVIGRETGVAGLTAVGVLFIALLAVLFWLAGRTTQPIGSALACGLTMLVCSQVLLATLALFHVAPPLGPGPPLLAGGASWYAATLISIGIVIGLAWRAPSQEDTTNTNRQPAAASVGQGPLEQRTT